MLDDLIDHTPQVQSPRNGELHFDIDLNDKCNLRCPTCFRGTGAQKNTPSVMPLEHFRHVVAKAHAEGYPNICLINWTEAFLLENLNEYVAVVKEFDGLDCWVSSNMSLPPARYLPSILSALAAGIDILFISTSGWTQQVYEINHARGRVDWIKENVAGIATALRDGRIKTNVWIRYLTWPYNEHEKSEWAALCKQYRIGFDPVPAHGDPLIPVPGFSDWTTIVRDRLEKVASRPLSRAIAVPDVVCSLIMDRAALDAKGDAYLCCAFPNLEALRIGKYTEMDEHEFLLKRHTHQFCRTCKIEPRKATERDRERYRQAIAATSSAAMRELA